MAFTQKILVPTDFSSGSEAAVHYATAMALEQDASIELVHAYEVPAMAFLEGSVIATPEAIASLTDAAQHQLDKVAAHIREAGAEVNAHLLQGVAYDEIVRGATAWGCDLIVMATHGRTGLRHALIGSVAERVIRTSTIPVLIIRRPESD